jgi:hypothetical protein
VPRLLFPFRFGNIPADASSATTSAAASTGRWSSVVGTAAAWAAQGAALLPRFEHVYPNVGRAVWSGGADTGVNTAYRINDEFPFIIDGTVTHDSESSIP